MKKKKKKEKTDKTDKKDKKDTHKKYNCGICNYQTTRSNNYHRHIASRLHQNNMNARLNVGNETSLQQISCPYCNRCFTRSSSLKRHITSCPLKDIDNSDKGSTSTNTTINIFHFHQVNIYFPEMIDIKQFINNLQSCHQLTSPQTMGLLHSYKDSISKSNRVITIG